jgi:hypothetical protein|tara:strand:+ start:50 stop:274 length:225 start_codon:yes stop_codon:yes gene_type:complete
MSLTLNEKQKLAILEEKLENERLVAEFLAKGGEVTQYEYGDRSEKGFITPQFNPTDTIQKEKAIKDRKPGDNLV